jgi:signal transduction histidine kinase/CheY-like chemotaxis protein
MIGAHKRRDRHGGDNRVARAVARVPTPIRTKLLIAFVAIVILLVAIGAIGLRGLGASNRRVETLAKLQHKVAVFEALQSNNDELRQLIAERTGADFETFVGSSRLFVPTDEGIEATLSALGASYDFHRFDFTPTGGEQRLLSQIQVQYGRFAAAMSKSIALDRRGRSSDAQRVQADEARPVADRLDASTGQLVNNTEADIVSLVSGNKSAYVDSQRIFLTSMGLAIVLALVLGFALSSSIIGPVRRIDRRLGEIASGDFSSNVEVSNRDELGSLAANLNRMNERLGRLYQDLASASRHKSEFLASMSHELRTQLNAIIGFSEVLRAEMFGPLNERQADYLGDILASGRHLLGLINDILDLSKIEAGKMELDVSVFSLPIVLEGGLTMVREQAARKSIALSLDVDPDVADIEADERKVKQIVFNLLSNAVKFTPDGGRIIVSARRADTSVEVSVADTGIGIAPEDLERIFEEFQQAGKREGSGLGLALARSFVVLHGGRLWVDSELGVRSTFTFSLPSPRDGAGLAAGSVPDDQPVVGTNGEERSVLVIEDDPRSAELLRVYLEGEGFTVAVTGTGEAGLEAARLVRPLAIVLDILLPGLSGWDVLLALKSEPSLARVPVVIVSMLDDSGRGYAMGAAAHLVKPVTREDLLGVLGPLVSEATLARTVLAVDDDPITVELIAGVLEPEGYRVLRASGGEEGIEIAQRESPDLVICDLLMPGTDGFDVVERLRADPSTGRIPIVVLTGQTISARDKEWLSSRVTQLAEKGDFSREVFVELVWRCCRAPVQ